MNDEMNGQSGANQDPKSSVVNILIIDDEQDVTEAVGEILRLASNYRVTTVNSAADAYRRLANNHYDLVITDFRMPKTNGLELIRAIRHKGHNQDVPIIVISGYPDEVRMGLGTISKVMLLAKPFSADVLIEAAAKMMKIDPTVKQGSIAKVPDELIQGIPIALRTMVAALTKCEDVEVGRRFVWNSSEHLNIGISAIVPFDGAGIRGFLTMSFPDRSFLLFTSEALGKRQIKITKDNQKFIGDLIQMLYSEVFRLISQNAGYDFVATQPQILLGPALPQFKTPKLTNLVLVMKSSLGEFYVIISVV